MVAHFFAWCPKNSNPWLSVQFNVNTINFVLYTRVSLFHRIITINQKHYKIRNSILNIANGCENCLFNQEVFVFSEFFFFLFFSFIYAMNRFVLRILSRPNTILKHFSTTHDHRLNTGYWIESVANECFSRTRKTLLIFVLIQTYGSTKKKIFCFCCYTFFHFVNHRARISDRLACVFRIPIQ